MDGLLVIDKPEGPTSHDVVARVRRAIGEKRIGHTGTLDPSASGVLPLVLGRATRLARFMSAAVKSYEAVVRLGIRTDSGDAAGQPIGALHPGPMPGREAIDRALDAFRGTFEQEAPAFSAKKIGGTPSYKLARRARRQGPSAAPAPDRKRCVVSTTVLDVMSLDGDLLGLRIECSAGFYVRALADELGERLGIGAHLATLRRTRSGDLSLADAVRLDDVVARPADAAARVVPLRRLLPQFGSVVLTADGVRRAASGCELGPSCCETAMPPSEPFIRLLSAGGDLVAIAEAGSAPGLLHPFVVLM